ncbi:MAG: type VI secretion system tip protein VgrG [Alcaligenaceae bacterium]|nr:type VI secretion system tip protein VgrG [Alcaligenaceae bacterium]
MATHLDSELLFTFELGKGSDAPRFRVVKFEGTEAISQLFRFDITLVSDQADIDLDAAMQSQATLRIYTRDHSRSTPYHGMLSSIEQLGKVDDYVFYHATLVPRLWVLGLNRVNDVYLDEKNIPDLIAGILERNDLKSPNVSFMLKNPGTYRERSFTCQFQETDLAFVSRWMEQEGLYYFFRHEGEQAGSDVMVITDYREAHPSQALELRYTPPENVQTDRQDTCVTSFICRKTHVPAKVLVQDFNFRKASLGDNLKAEQTVAGGDRGEVMFYGDNLRREEDAQRIATMRAEELASQATVFNGEAPAIGVRAGYFMALSSHYRTDFNDRYLVTRVRHQGSQTGVVLAGQNTAYNANEQGSIYQCSFSAIKASLQYRAPRSTPKPVIAGFLSAIIDSEGDGQLAELNEYGQYKVQLMYDYSSKSANKGSSWLRMATPYAGKHEGMHFPLLKGTEVLIGFSGGDPDQPIILGAVPNSENQSIIRDINAACNAVRTVSGNVMNMVDRPGKEGVMMHSPVASSYVYIGSFPIAGDDATPSDSKKEKGSDPVALINSL